MWKLSSSWPPGLVAGVVGVADVANVAVVAAAVLSLHLLMLANREPSVSRPLSSAAWLGNLGDFQSRRGGFIRSCNRDAAFGRSWGHLPVAAGDSGGSALHVPSPASTRMLRAWSLFPSEPEEAEIELVCTFGLLMVLLTATSLAHF